MLRRFVSACVLVLPVLGGDSHSPGAPCPVGQTCTPPDEGGTNSAAPAEGDSTAVLVDGVLLIFSLF